MKERIKADKDMKNVNKLKQNRSALKSGKWTTYILPMVNSNSQSLGYKQSALAIELTTLFTSEVK